MPKACVPGVLTGDQVKEKTNKRTHTIEQRSMLLALSNGLVQSFCLPCRLKEKLCIYIWPELLKKLLEYIQGLTPKPENLHC